MKNEKKIMSLLEEVKSLIEGEEKIKTKSFPQDGDTFYFLHTEGSVSSDKYSDEDAFNVKCKAIGNIYKTKEEAEQQVKKLKAIVEVKNYVKENFGYDPEGWADWGDSNENKYIINMSIGVICYDLYTYKKVYSPTGYIKTEEEVQELKEKLPNELDIIYK